MPPPVGAACGAELSTVRILISVEMNWPSLTSRVRVCSPIEKKETVKGLNQEEILKQDFIPVCQNNLNY